MEINRQKQDISSFYVKIDFRKPFKGISKKSFMIQNWTSNKYIKALYTKPCNLFKRNKFVDLCMKQAHYEVYTPSNTAINCSSAYPPTGTQCRGELY